MFLAIINDTYRHVSKRTNCTNYIVRTDKVFDVGFFPTLKQWLLRRFDKLKIEFLILAAK